MNFKSRSIVVLLVAFLCSAFCFGKEVRTSKYLLYVGTYTDKGAKGIYVYRYDAGSGQLSDSQVAAETVNSSFVTIDDKKRLLYAVNELQKYQNESSGGVSAFSVGPRGQLHLLNEVASGGADPCYVSIDKSGKYVLVANYTGGSISVFPIRQDGSLGAPTAFIQHKGSGPNRERQEAAHAHWIETSPDNRFAIASDLGIDELLVYRFDASTGKLAPNDPPFAKAEPGAGPRHLAFAPSGKFAYVINELQSTVSVFSYDAANGVLHPLQTISALPKKFSGENTAAEIAIHPNGRFLFASNRGHDSIAVFSIDKAKGTLRLIDNFSVKGRTPRSFVIDPTGSRLLVANQDTGNIVVFRINRSTGRLTATGQEVKVPAPVCLKFMKELNQNRRR
ncbi:MAG TPA: lactonase family protein [Terriglobales bacterium]|nr:lactonase family protein [Terriglobales bacterium]